MSAHSCAPVTPAAVSTARKCFFAELKTTRSLRRTLCSRVLRVVSEEGAAAFGFEERLELMGSRLDFRSHPPLAAIVDLQCGRWENFSFRALLIDMRRLGKGDDSTVLNTDASERPSNVELRGPCQPDHQVHPSRSAIEGVQHRPFGQACHRAPCSSCAPIMHRPVGWSVNPSSRVGRLGNVPAEPGHA